MSNDDMNGGDPFYYDMAFNHQEHDDQVDALAYGWKTWKAMELKKARRRALIYETIRRVAAVAIGASAAYYMLYVL